MYRLSINILKIISRLLANSIYSLLGGSFVWGFITIALDADTVGWLLFAVAGMLLSMMISISLIIHMYITWRDNTWGWYLDEDAW